MIGSTRRTSTVMLTATLLCTAASLAWAEHLRSDPATQVGERESPANFVEMPVDYGRAMLVIVTDQGAAGVRFIDSFESGNESGNGIVGTSYEWRYLERRPDAAERNNTGRVYSKLVDGEIQHGNFDIDCGPIRIVWRHNDNKSCFVRYDPQASSVHPVAAEYFADRKNPGVPATVIEAVDLSRFLYPNAEAIRQHRNERYAGPDSDSQRWEKDAAGPVFYKNCVLVARDPYGVATFEFGPVFERQPNNDETLYGVEYRFSFSSHDGKTTREGTAEVYERYKDRKYSGGRLHLEAGPLHLSWSRGGDDLGWVYYDPIWSRVSYVSSAHAMAVRKTMLAAGPTVSAE